MVCPKCGGVNVMTHVVSDTKSVNRHHSVLWWVFVGWYWIPIKWLVFTLPALIVKLFGNNRHKVVSEHHTMCVCQACGYTWEATPKVVKQASREISDGNPTGGHFR